MSDDNLGIIIILVIIAIALFGGAKNFKGQGLFSTTNQDNSLEYKVSDTQKKVDELKKQVQAVEDAKTQSKYKDIVSIQYVNKSNNPSNEYIVLRVKDDAKSTIPITGWQLKSLSSGSGANIPYGTLLFFSGTLNAEDAIILYPGDVAYIITGSSPNGSSFRLNKCSGYLSQFQTFIPYIYTSCPRPRDEDLSSIPKRVENDDCLDYIDSYSSCKTQTENLPVAWGYECKKFITEKLNYSSCVNTHKSDKDFYQKDWRIYLKRSQSVWKDRREEIVLYDNEGKIVSTLKY